MKFKKLIISCSIGLVASGTSFSYGQTVQQLALSPDNLARNGTFANDSFWSLATVVGNNAAVSNTWRSSPNFSGGGTVDGGIFFWSNATGGVPSYIQQSINTPRAGNYSVTFGYNYVLGGSSSPIHYINVSLGSSPIQSVEVPALCGTSGPTCTGVPQFVAQPAQATLNFNSIAAGANNLRISYGYNGTFLLLDNVSVLYLGPNGPSAEETQSSIQLSANRLRGIYNLQSAALINGLSYDCQVFDVNNICLSTGGRYSNNHGAYGNTTSALLIGAYRLSKSIRLGAWVDQNLSANTTTGVSLSNSKPLFGIFGAWSENPTGEGYEVKISAGYGDKDLNVTRDVVGTSEPGVGNSRLNSQAISSVSSYGFRINNELLASPYVGIRYSRIASNGYTESGSAVTAPLTYNNLTQENVALLAGLRLSVKLDPKTTFVASAGVEQNLKNRSGQYSATGVDGLTPIAFNSNSQKTRATASVGAYYDIDKKQRVSVNGIYREETFSPIATTMVLATYTIGL